MEIQFMQAGQQRDDTPRPLMSAQYAELIAWMGHLSLPHHFEKGQIVREKPGLGILNNPESHALAFLRYFDEDDWFDRLLMERLAKEFDFSMMAMAPDCVVVILDDKALSLTCLPISSERLEPIPDVEVSALIESGS
jgi:hypothetical protein